MWYLHIDMETSKGHSEFDLWPAQDTDTTGHFVVDQDGFRYKIILTDPYREIVEPILNTIEPGIALGDLLPALVQIDSIQSARYEAKDDIIVSFSHNTLVANLNVEDAHGELQRISTKYNGLCELICNQVLQENLLGSDGKFLDPLGGITLETLNRENVRNSHIVELHSTIRLIIAWLFNWFPNNFLSWSDQRTLIDGEQVNGEVLEPALANLEVGETLKMEVFRRSGVSFSGHSVLIKKTGEGEYSFFDPNFGESPNLGIYQLESHINDQIARHRATKLLFIRGSDFLQKLREEGVITNQGDNL